MSERIAELMETGCSMSEAIRHVAFEEAQDAWAELDATLCCHDYDEATLRAAKRAFEVLNACLKRRARSGVER